MDPERLKVMRLAEEQEREVLRNIWGMQLEAQAPPFVQILTAAEGDER